jgi:hypothetical protein
MLVVGIVTTNGERVDSELMGRYDELSDKGRM